MHISVPADKATAVTRIKSLFPRLNSPYDPQANNSSTVVSPFI